MSGVLQRTEFLFRQVRDAQLFLANLDVLPQVVANSCPDFLVNLEVLFWSEVFRDFTFETNMAYALSFKQI